VLAECVADVRLCTPTDSTVTRLFVTARVNAPVKKGHSIAVLKIFENGTLVQELALTAKADVPINKKGLFG